MLIDFGTTQKPPNAQKKLMMDIAKDIAHRRRPPARDRRDPSPYRSHQRLRDQRQEERNGRYHRLAEARARDPAVDGGPERTDRIEGPGHGTDRRRQRRVPIVPAAHADGDRRPASGRPGTCRRRCGRRSRSSAQNGLSNLSAVKNLAKMGNNGKIGLRVLRTRRFRS